LLLLPASNFDKRHSARDAFFLFGWAGRLALVRLGGAAGVGSAVSGVWLGVWVALGRAAGVGSAVSGRLGSQYPHCILPCALRPLI